MDQTRRCSWITGILAFVLTTAHGGESGPAEYPFDTPTSVTASISVNADARTPVKTMLLGMNVNWPENLYGKVGFNHPDAPRLIRAFNPSSLRFPHGVWANFYDWESDGRRKTDEYKTPYDGAVTGHPTLKYGFNSFHQLHQELKFDVLFTYNVNYDSPEKGVRRLKDRTDKGFEVKWIELGNEPFWKTQRSAAIETQEKYIAVSKAHAAALKAENPSIQVSVPVHWRDAETNPWNQPFLKETYFDAITVHKHMGGGPKHVLYTGQTLEEMTDTFRSLFPNHPIWLSEWATGKGESALCALGMADGYLTLFEQQDAYDIACFFQLNAKNPLFRYDKKTRVHTKTALGATYEMIRDLFENADLLETTVQSTELEHNKAAIRAAAVIKDGKGSLLVINKSLKPATLQVRVNNRKTGNRVQIHSIAFNDLNENKTYELDAPVTVEIPLKENRVMVPPLSINRIDL